MFTVFDQRVGLLITMEGKATLFALVLTGTSCSSLGSRPSDYASEPVKCFAGAQRAEEPTA